mgnify:CR=1 FL=1
MATGQQKRGFPVRLFQPPALLAVAAAVSLGLGMLLLGQATATTGLLVSVASILGGAALLASILAAVELLLALLAWRRWSRGAQPLCRHCDWPLSPSLILPGRCLNPDVPHRG